MDQVGVGAAMFAVNVGGCDGPAAIFGHDRFKSPKGFALGFKMGRGKSKKQGFSGTGTASALPLLWVIATLSLTPFKPSLGVVFGGALVVGGIILITTSV